MVGMHRVGKPQNRQRFQIEDRSPNRAIIDSVVHVTDTDPIELEPLAERVDPDALNELLATTDKIVIEFKWEGLVIRMDGTGEIVIEQW